VSTAHKLKDEWLLSYAAGALNPGRSLMVASHLAYHDDLQNTVADGEAIGGALLNSMAEADVNDTVFDQLMSRIDQNPVAEVKPITSGSSPYPEALTDFIDGDVNSLKWHFMGPGMQQTRLWTGPNDERLWLLKARGGVMVPEHGHNGEEWTLLLKGSYNTAFGDFGVGDIDIADADIVHQPKINPDEECVCLVLAEGPVRLNSLLGRMVQPLIGV
jgi:putative transcriptional regulator